jgi:type IV secretory pathway TrbD component
MNSFDASRRRGWFARLTAAQRGWVLLGGSLAVTLALAASGASMPMLSGILAVLMCFGLVLALISLFGGSHTMALAAVRRGMAAPGHGASGRVPASWEYYETFGR